MTNTLIGKVMIIKRETIKPSSPTPTSIATLKLSIVDKIMGHVYVPLLLVYPSTMGSNKTTDQICQHLKTSLSKTLPFLYPLAGRVVDDSYIDCDDSGVEFIEVKLQCDLADYFANPVPDTLMQFLPTSSEIAANMLMLAQVNFFQCGGLVIGVRLSHKIADASTLSTFLKCWSAMALDGHLKEELIPMPAGDSYIPQLDTTVPIPKFRHIQLQGDDYQLKKFVFDCVKLKALKVKVASCNPELSDIIPTRFEVVSSLLWKCAVKASRTKIVRSRPTVMCFPVNLRRKFTPPIPHTHVGNIIAIVNVTVHQDGCELDLARLIIEMRKEIYRLSDELHRKKKFIGDHISELYSQYFNNMTLSDVDSYSLASWCNFDLYEADFGWGKPAWISFGKAAGKNSGVLMDTKDRGIEAWFGLEKDEMTLFESDPELLQYAKVHSMDFLNEDSYKE